MLLFKATGSPLSLEPGLGKPALLPERDCTAWGPCCLTQPQQAIDHLQLVDIHYSTEPLFSHFVVFFPHKINHCKYLVMETWMLLFPFLLNMFPNQLHLPETMWKPITQWLIQDKSRVSNHHLTFLGASVCLNCSTFLSKVILKIRLRPALLGKTAGQVRPPVCFGFVFFLPKISISSQNRKHYFHVAYTENFQIYQSRLTHPWAILGVSHTQWSF